MTTMQGKSMIYFDYDNLGIPSNAVLKDKGKTMKKNLRSRHGRPHL